MTTIDQVEKAPASSGKTHLLKHLYEEKLTARQAIAAKCCECSGFYFDGRESCTQKDCPLFPFMPYNKEKRKSRVVSDEQKAEMSKRMKKRAKKAA